MDGHGRTRAARTGRWAAGAVATLLAVACATPPPPVRIEPLPPPPPPLESQACMACLDSSEEIARLRQALAAREAELRDLRAGQREQARVAAESSRDAAQAQARQRRLATQADAASAIAEAEVEQQAAREKLPMAPAAPLHALAASAFEAASAAFARNDFGAAYDRATQAQALFAASIAAFEQSRARPATEILLRGGVPMRAASRTPLRRQPGGPATGTVPAGAPLTALAWRGGYLQVTTTAGAKGWIAEDQVALR